MEKKTKQQPPSLNPIEKVLFRFLVNFYLALGLFIIVMLPIAIAVQLVRWVF